MDHAASQLDKQARLRGAGIAAPPNLSCAAADLEADALIPRVASAGPNPLQSTFVACLGVLIYLREGTLDAIIAMVTKLPTGSQFVFTFSRSDVATAGSPAPGSPAARVAAAGEPWRTRIEPEAVEAMLRTAGFRSLAFLDPEDVDRRYLNVMKTGLAGDNVGLSKQPAPGGPDDVVRRIGPVAPEGGRARPR